MESTEQTGAYIYPPICTNCLIFGNGAFFILSFLNMLTNPIISQISLFMTSHFSTLFECLIQEEKSVTGRFDKLRLQKLGFYYILQKWPKSWTRCYCKANQAKGSSRTRTWDCQIAGPALWPLGHTSSIDMFSFGNTINEIKSSAFMSYYILIV